MSDASKIGHCERPFLGDLSRWRHDRLAIAMAFSA